MKIKFPLKKWKGFKLLQLEECSGIYFIINLVNGKSYIGSSIMARKRSGVHLNCRGSIVVARAVKKHGRKNFAAFILEKVEVKNLFIAEGKWIKLLAPEYNLAFVDEIGRTTLSEESRKLMSIKRKARITTEETRAKMRAARQNVSIETRQKIAKASRERKRNYSIEVLEKLARLGRERMTGHKHSEETKAKMRESGKIRAEREGLKCK